MQYESFYDIVYGGFGDILYILRLKMTPPIFFKLNSNDILFIVYVYIIMIFLKYIACGFEKSFHSFINYI